MFRPVVLFLQCLFTPSVALPLDSSVGVQDFKPLLVGHDLQVELDPQAHSLKARDIISLEVGEEETVFLSFNTTLQIHSVKIGPQPTGQLGVPAAPLEVSPVRMASGD